MVHRQGYLKANKCASGDLISVAISAGAVLSGYLIQRDGFSALGLSPRRQYPIDDDLIGNWAEVTRGLPDECRKALWEAILASSEPDPYPTNAAHHLVQGMSHLGDVYDESWNKVLSDIVTFVVDDFSIHRGDWSDACAIVQRVCTHLERRAEANLNELAKHGSVTMDHTRDAALRESRKSFLEKVVILKHDLFVFYGLWSERAIQQGNDIQLPDGATQQPQALARREVNMPAYAATTELLVQAADLVIKQLPPSREYASSPEEVHFLKCYKRARVFLGSFSPALLTRQGSPLTACVLAVSVAELTPHMDQTSHLSNTTRKII